MINLNNIKIAVVNLQNIKKKNFLSIMIILTSSIEFKSINFLHIEITIIKLNFWMMSNFRKVEHIECSHTSLNRLRNISSKTCLKVLSYLKKFRISHRCYSQWKLTKICNFMLIIKNSMSWQSEIDIFCSW